MLVNIQVSVKYISKPNQPLTNIAPTINNDNTDTILSYLKV